MLLLLVPGKSSPAAAAASPRPSKDTQNSDFQHVAKYLEELSLSAGSEG